MKSLFYLSFLFSFYTWQSIGQNATVTATVTSSTSFSVNFIPSQSVTSSNQIVPYGITLRIPKSLFTAGSEPPASAWGYVSNPDWGGTPSASKYDTDPGYWVYRFINASPTGVSQTFNAGQSYLLASFTLPAGVTLSDVELVDYANNRITGSGPGTGGTVLSYAGTNRINDSSGPFSATSGSTGAANNCGAATCTSTLSLSNEILPIELLAFEPRSSGCDSYLYWETATEKNFAYYQIEASKDGQNFNPIAQQKPQSPNSLQMRSYKYLIPQQYQGYYFRLKSIDLDGAFEYSKVVLAPAPCDKQYDMQLYPNPNYLEELTVEINSADAQEQVQILLLDPLSKVIRIQKVDILQGSNKIPMDTQDLPSGTYYIRIIGIPQLPDPLKFIISKF